MAQLFYYDYANHGKSYIGAFSMEVHKLQEFSNIISDHLQKMQGSKGLSNSPGFLKIIKVMLSLYLESSGTFLIKIIAEVLSTATDGQEKGRGKKSNSGIRLLSKVQRSSSDFHCMTVLGSRPTEWLLNQVQHAAIC